MTGEKEEKGAEKKKKKKSWYLSPKRLAQEKHSCRKEIPLPLSVFTIASDSHKGSLYKKRLSTTRRSHEEKEKTNAIYTTP